MCVPEHMSEHNDQPSLDLSLHSVNRKIYQENTKVHVSGYNLTVGHRISLNSA